MKLLKNKPNSLPTQWWQKPFGGSSFAVNSFCAWIKRLSSTQLLRTLYCSVHTCTEYKLLLNYVLFQQKQLAASLIGCRIARGLLENCPYKKGQDGRRSLTGWWRFSSVHVRLYTQPAWNLMSVYAILWARVNCTLCSSAMILHHSHRQNAVCIWPSASCLKMYQRHPRRTIAVHTLRVTSAAMPVYWIAAAQAVTCYGTRGLWCRMTVVPEDYPLSWPHRFMGTTLRLT